MGGSHRKPGGGGNTSGIGEILAIAREDGDLYNTAFALEGLARLFAVQGQPAWAARLWGEAEMLRERMGISLLPVERNGYEQAVVAARARLGEKAFASTWAEGRATTAEQVLSTLGSVPMTAPSSAAPPSAHIAKASPAYPAGLSAREVEVLRLVADQLIISPRTVNYHLSSIYSKIRVSSRSAATRYAIEQHLL